MCACDAWLAWFDRDTFYWLCVALDDCFLGSSNQRRAFRRGICDTFADSRKVNPAISFERSGNGSGRGQKQKEISCTSPAPPSSVCVMRVLAPAATLVVGGHALAALPASTRLHGLFGGLAFATRLSITNQRTHSEERNRPVSDPPPQLIAHQSYLTNP